jgi:hypothetical protein
MRVSPTFNSLSAPLLYRSITIDDSTQWRFTRFPKTPDGLDRLTEDNLLNVKYVDEVRFNYSHRGPCVKNILPATNTLDVSILKIFEVRDWDGSSIDRSNRCTCTDNINASKIVYENCSLNQHITDTLPAKPPIQTITNLLDGRVALTRIASGWALRHVRSLHYRPPLAATLVIVFRPTNSLSGNEHVRLRLLLANIRESVFLGVQKDVSPDYICVNLESILGPQDVENSTNRSPAELITANIEKEYSRFTQSAKFTHLTIKPWKEVRPGQIKFVSMKTYFTEYDWRGEFTESEVKRYLA